jgi:hypothetical protein
MKRSAEKSSAISSKDDAGLRGNHIQGKTILRKSKRNATQTEYQDHDDADEHHGNLNSQEKWNTVALIWREFNPETKTFPPNVYEKVAGLCNTSVRTVRRVQQEYFDKVNKTPHKVPDLSPKPHGHPISGLSENIAAMKDS